MQTPGVFLATKKDGTTYYRASLTFHNKHISLGSFSNEDFAHKAYIEATNLLKNENNRYTIDSYSPKKHFLAFSKWIILINFRDNKMYCKTPIYLKSKYFIYYLTFDIQLKFDVDDLFYYSHHKIMKRGGYLFVSDYGMQINILSRYGVKNFAVINRDYLFVNGDTTDYRYGNIKIINPYYGVTKVLKNGLFKYVSKIHINGDVIIGTYSTDVDAAIAYNKAIDILFSKGVTINYTKNYLIDLNEIEYAKAYSQIRISKFIRTFEQL